MERGARNEPQEATMKRSSPSAGKTRVVKNVLATSSRLGCGGLARVRVQLMRAVVGMATKPSSMTPRPTNSPPGFRSEISANAKSNCTSNGRSTKPRNFIEAVGVEEGVFVGPNVRAKRAPTDGYLAGEADDKHARPRRPGAQPLVLRA